MSKIKILTMPNIYEDVEQPELLCVAGGNVKCYHYSGKKNLTMFLIKLNMPLPYNPESHLFSVYAEKWNTSAEDLYENVHRSLMYSKTEPMTTKRKINKWIMECACIRLLRNSKRDWVLIDVMIWVTTSCWMRETRYKNSQITWFCWLQVLEQTRLLGRKGPQRCLPLRMGTKVTEKRHMGTFPANEGFVWHKRLHLTELCQCTYDLCP